MEINRICEYASEENFEEGNFYISPKGNNFVFVYKKNGQYFAQVKNDVFGGYTVIENVSFTPNGRLYSFKNASFKKIIGIIKDDNKEYLIINGKEFGPFGNVYSFKLNNNSTFYLNYRDYFKIFVKVNKQKFGGFDKVRKVEMSDDGKFYAFHYIEGAKHFFRYNASVHGEYDNLDNLIIDFDHDFFGFCFKKETGMYANINGKILGPYLKADELEYNSDFKMSFFKFSTESGNYVQFNDKVFGPYESIGSPYFSVKKDFIYVNYVRDGFEKYLVILRNIGVYKDVEFVKHDILERSFMFTYVKGGYHFAIKNNKKFGPFNLIKSQNISPNGKNICFVFEQDNYEFLNINDNIYGHYDQITEISIGNELDYFGFVYYKNSKYYVRIGSKVFGLYDNAFNLVVSSNGEGFSYNFLKTHKNIVNMFKKDEVFTSIDGEIVDEYWDVLSYQRNSNGKKAIIYMYNGETSVYYDGNTYGQYYSITNPHFLKRNDLFSFRFKEEQKGLEHLQIENEKYFSLNKFNTVLYPMFSNDNQKYGFIHYKDEKYYVQVTDRTYGPYDFAVAPSFSLNGKIVIFKYMVYGNIFFNINDTEFGPFGEGDYVFVENKLYIVYLYEHEIRIDEFIENGE